MANLSPVDICNQALSWVGGNPITSQEFDSPSSAEARLCKANYEALRDAVLEDHPWTFAVKRQVLSKSTLPVPALYNGSNFFPLPADCIRILDCSSDGVFTEEKLDFELENRGVITDVETLYVRYIARISDTGVMSPQFTQAVAARMAMEFAIPLTNSRAMYESMSQMYMIKLQEARTLDSMQGTTRQITASWIRKARMR